MEQLEDDIVVIKEDEDNVANNGIHLLYEDSESMEGHLEVDDHDVDDSELESGGEKSLSVGLSGVADAAMLHQGTMVVMATEGDEEMEESDEGGSDEDNILEAVQGAGVHLEQVLGNGEEASGVDLANIQQVQLTPVVQLMGSGAGGQGMQGLAEQVIHTMSLPDGQTLQTITLSDGSTAFIQPPGEGRLMEGQTIQLEDGTTAIVQDMGIPQMQSERLTQTSPISDVQHVGNKFMEGQMIQLEDGTTGFIQTTATGPDAVHTIQLEDGTTAYITGSLFGGNGDQAVSTTTAMATSVSEGVVAAAGDHMTLAVAQGVTGAQALADHASMGHVSQEMAEGVVEGAMTTMPQRLSERALALGDKAYKCAFEGCGRLYTTQHHLKVHERSHTGDRPFKCEFIGCGKAFATGYGLKSHTRVHTGEKPYRCPVDTCQKSFKTSGDLQKHVRTHTGERPFRCPFEGCNRTFTTSNIRKVHIRTHTGERPYICTEDGCGKAFASATNYKNHIRIHSGEKPYVCTVQGCGKRFTEYSSLYKHHVVHTHSKPYTCNHCGKTYRQTSTLAMHKRTVHGDTDTMADGDAALVTAVTGVHVVAAGAESPALKDGTLHMGLSGGCHDDDDVNLVINASHSQKHLVRLDGGVSRVTHDAETVTLGSLSSVGQMTVEPQAAILHQQHQQINAESAGDSVGLSGGNVPLQQVYLITDPGQVAMLKQLAQQNFGDPAAIQHALQELQAQQESGLEVVQTHHVTSGGAPHAFQNGIVTIAPSADGSLHEGGSVVKIDGDATVEGAMVRAFTAD